MASPLKCRDAERQLRQVGAVLKRTTASHQVWRHPAWQSDLIVPTHGSKGRSTISPGMSAVVRKALAAAT
jgi:predicted RNA binding protein YcfA (HicA-like mRNA interferase family)